MRIGIDLGGTKTEGIVMDATGAILARQRRPTPGQKGYEAILNNIRDLVLDLERQAGTRCTVGIGTPGSLSARTGTLKNANTTCLNGMPIKSDLEGLLAREIRIANDANCLAVSEATDGAGRGYPLVFAVILGTGVGGGLVVNGWLHEGPQQLAGEWGHNVLDPTGPDCYCGKRGCIETFLSGPGIAADYHQAGGGRALDALAIVARALAGEALAEATMQRYLDRFGRAMAMVINILDPHAIVLGGGLSNIPRLYTEGRHHIARHIFAAHGCASAAGGRGPEAAAAQGCACANVAGGVTSAEDGASTEGAPDELLTAIVQSIHGDSSGVRGAAHLWRADELV